MAGQATRWATKRTPRCAPILRGRLRSLHPAHPRLTLLLPPSLTALAKFRNAAIEKWAKYKEDYHIRFQWTPQRVFDVALWAFAVPYALYSLVVHEQVRRPPCQLAAASPQSSPSLSLT